MIEYERHIPSDFLLRTESLPTSWCSGCGIGTAVHVFTQAVNRAEIPPDEICLLSTGIGCTGKVTDYLTLHSDEPNGGRIIDHAMQLTSNNPDLKIVLFLDDADYIVEGVETFVQAGDKGMDICIIYVNTYLNRIFREHKISKRKLEEESKPGKRFASRLHIPYLAKFRDALHVAGRIPHQCKRLLEPLMHPRHQHKTSNGTHGEVNKLEKHFQSPFNVPHLAKLCGAQNVARWTAHHPNRLLESLMHALRQRSYSVIEVISPCLMYHINVGMTGKSIDRRKMYQDRTVINNNEPTENLDLRLQENIIVGEFIHHDE